MTASTDLPDVTMANTKKQMLDAYQEMKTLLTQREKATIDAERERDRFKKEAAQAAAERAAANDPVRQLHELKATIGRELASMSEQYETTVEEYGMLQRAVADKTDELERIYSVDSAAQDLTALIEAHGARKAAFEAEDASARAEWQAERSAHEAETASARARLELEREREQEAYEYGLARDHERRRTELEDELAALEREIAEKRGGAEHEIAEARAAAEAGATAKAAELATREQTVAEREQHADRLQEQVDGFPAQLAAEVDRAVKETTARQRAAHEAEIALARKEHEGERNVLASRIDSLKQLIEQQSRQIETLSAQQERAYAQMQDIASKAVEGAHRSGAVPAPQPRSQRPFDESD